MHDNARQFLTFVQQSFPSYFENVKCLDVGSADINGNNRMHFQSCEYHGNDVCEGPNVTIVAETGKLTFQDGYFDTIVSSECFEHDMHYEDSFRNIVRMLRPGGLFAFTCASTGRNEHGTRRTHPTDSMTTRIGDDTWGDYYKNLEESDVREVIDVDTIFKKHQFLYHPGTKDLYFWGIKKDPNDTDADTAVIYPTYHLDCGPKETE